MARWPMSRRQKNPLRPLTGAERSSLARLSRSQGAPAAQVARARALLAVAEGRSYTAAARLVGRATGDTVAPEGAGDGPATGSLTTLRDARRGAEDGLPAVSTHTIGRALHTAGFTWQKGRSWCETGVVVRKRRHAGPVTVTDPDAAAKRG